MSAYDQAILKVKLEAESKQLEAQLRKIDRQIDNLGGASGGGTKRIQQGFKDASGQASNFVSILTGDRLTGATSQISALSGAIGGIPGPTGLAIGAVVGLTAAAVAGVTALYGLSKGAADYGSTIFDAATKTGLGAETISSIKIAADQSGSSLEQFTSGLARFDKTVGAAAQGSKEAALNLKALGIEPQAALNDLDGALGKVFKRIAEAKPGIEQTTLAQKAFGKSGADLIPTIMSFDGNLPGLIKHMKDLGVTMSDQDAAAADEFGDQMDILGVQFAGVGRTIGMEVMPIFQDFAEYTSDWLADNKGEIKSWGEFTADVLSGVIALWNEAADAEERYHLLTGALGMASSAGGVSGGDVLTSLFPPALIAKMLANKGSQQPGVIRMTDLDYASKTPRLRRGWDPTAFPEDPEKAKRESDKAARDAERAAEKARREAEKAERERIGRARQSYQEETQLFAAERAKMLAVAIQFATDNKKTDDDMARFEEELADQVLEYKKSKLQAYQEVLVKGTDEYAKSQHEMKILDFEIEEQKAKFAKNEEERQKKAREDEEKLRKERRKSWSEYVRFIEDINDRANEESDRAANERQLMRRRRGEAGSVMGGGGLGAGIAGGMGMSLPSVWDDTTNQIKSQAEFLKSIYADVSDFAGGAIGSMVDGLAQLGVNWLMAGEFSAQAALRMLAASALHIAFEATMKGWFEIAEAAAAAARLDFAGAKLHMLASGIYFKTAAIASGIGVGAALGSRAAGGGGGQGGGGGEQGAYGGGSGRQTTPEPFSRVSEDAYISGRRGGDAAMLRFVLEKLHDKLNAVPPGHVFMAGMRQNPGAVGQQVATDIGRNANIGRTILSKSGVR